MATVLSYLLANLRPVGRSHDPASFQRDLHLFGSRLTLKESKQGGCVEDVQAASSSRD